MNFELQIEDPLLCVSKPLKSMYDRPTNDSMTPLSCQLEYSISLKFGSVKSPVSTPKRDLEKVQEAHNNTLEQEDSCSEQDS